MGTYEIINYVNDVSLQNAQVLMTSDKDGNYDNAYTYGLDRISVDNLASDELGKRDPLYYMYDGRGSVAQLTNSQGQVRDKYSYDPFGVINHGGPLGNSTNQYENFYGYNGEDYNRISELEYLRARYYEPETGRFLTRDSYLGSIMEPLSLNRYAYAGNNPLMYNDPSGHFWNPIKAITSGISSAWKSTKSFVSSAYSVVSSFVSSAYKKTSNFVSSAYNNFREGASKTYTSYKTKAETTINNIKKSATVIKAQIKQKKASKINSAKNTAKEKAAKAAERRKKACEGASVLTQEEAAKYINGGSFFDSYYENEITKIPPKITFSKGNYTYTYMLAATRRPSFFGIEMPVDNRFGTKTFSYQLSYTDEPEISMGTVYIGSLGNVTGGGKAVPNPNGKNGGLPHQTTIGNIKPMSANGRMQTEYKYNTPNGTKSYRYADKVEVVDGEVTKIYQAGKVSKNGLPITRESKAIEDIMNSTDYNGAPIYFMPYNSNMGPSIYLP
jgi:RHS repeat-associated protein